MAERPPPLPELLAALRVAMREEIEPDLRRLREEVDALRRALPPQLVSLEDAATRLGLSERTLRRRVRDGSIAVRRVGRRVLVDVGALHPLDNGDVARLAREARSGGV